jgi:hypothetical protein
MAKFGMYTKGSNESNQHVSTVNVQTRSEAEAYFAGRKQITMVQFHNMFIVREINEHRPNKDLLLG